jgi:cytochrome c oxidase subunit 4
MNHHPHIMPVRTNIQVFVALLVLLFATVVAAYLPMGALHFPVAMTIAVAKAMLIVLFFMHVLHSHRLTMVVAIAGFLWLGILIALTLSDYLSRYPGGWLDIPGK